MSQTVREPSLKVDSFREHVQVSSWIDTRLILKGEFLLITTSFIYFFSNLYPMFSSSIQMRKDMIYMEAIFHFHDLMFF